MTSIEQYQENWRIYPDGMETLFQEANLKIKLIKMTKYTSDSDIIGIGIK